MYSNILVTLDSSGQSEPVLSCLQPLLRKNHTTIRLTSIYPSMRTIAGQQVIVYGHQLEAQATTEALRYLDKAATRLRERGVHVLVDVRFGHVVGSVLSAIRATPVDLLVLPVPWYRGDGRQLPADMTTRLMQRTAVPVLLCPLQAAQPGAGEGPWTWRR